MQTSINARRVLFVDDDALLGKMFGNFLANSGYETRATENGAAALKQVVEFQPHLVVLDIGLPDISGLEVLRQIKTNPSSRHNLVILITGTTGLEMKIEGFQTGANDYLCKPINLRELRLKVDRCFATLQDEESAIVLKQKEILNSLAHTLGQGFTAPLAAIRTEVRLSLQENPCEGWVARIARIDNFAQQAEQILTKFCSQGTSETNVFKRCTNLTGPGLVRQRLTKFASFLQ